MTRMNLTGVRQLIIDKGDCDSFTDAAHPVETDGIVSWRGVNTDRFVNNSTATILKHCDLLKLKGRAPPILVHE